MLPPGRMLLAALAVPADPGGHRARDHPRGGKIHLRLWLAIRVADELGVERSRGAVLLRWYARLLGASRSTATSTCTASRR